MRPRLAASRDADRASGLEAVIGQGARRRQHRTLQFATATAPATILGGIAASLIYLTVLVSAGRVDWLNIFVGAGATGAVPFIAASILILVAKREEPVTIALASTVFAGALVTSVMAATRVPISFTGILASLPASLIATSFANVALARKMSQSVAVLAFRDASDVANRLGPDTAIMSPDDLDHDVDRILIDPQAHHTPQYAPLLARLYLRGTSLEPWPAFLERRHGRVDIGTFDLSDVAYTPGQIVYYRAKRVLDVSAVILFALPALMIAAVIWSYIRLIDGGPSLFVQERRGYGGTVFNIYKFRTMRLSDDVTSTRTHDPRILPGCGFLRHSRLDELPQLYNVLRGDMSLIGPRPVSVHVAEDLESRIPEYVNRQILLPGLTGWAQVSQGYASTQNEELLKLSYDLYYLKYVSLDLDIIILVRTIRTILFRQGAK